ncbi:flagellar basal body-associated FliL family protein [Zobellella iuensis]|uniref:Flagellar protein FliL n=1 Tax=Zobellella iuensis TaxID=2803811 RepID=A0ABS1QWM4_9GAMM|nr:flagellar basal body-associated FliL family protein [Zobellella iuensis]
MAEKSRAKTLMVLLLVLAALLGGMWTGTFVLADYRESWAKGELVSGLLEKKARPEPVSEPRFKQLDQFVIGLPGSGRNHYMVLELALMSRQAEQLQLWEGVLPALRNTTLGYFSGFDHERVQGQLQDMGQFEQELQTALNQRLQSYGYAPSVEGVLITKLVIQ